MRAETNSVAVPGKFEMMVKPVLMGTLAGLIISLIILAVCSYAMTVRDMPDNVISTLSLISIASGCLTGGFISAKKHKKSGLLVGTVTGLGMFLVLFFAGLAIQHTGVGVSGLIKLIVSASGGAIGGIVGVNARSGQKKR